MSKIFTIGRNGDQPFKITSEGVSGEHARITISDAGEWYLQDLKGVQGNGTFIRDEKGNFVRISKCRITERTIIRLADSGRYSYTFMAHRVLVAKPNDYSFEFDCVCQMAEEIREKEEKLDKTLHFHSVIGIAAPILALGVTCLPFQFFEKNPFLARIVITASSSLVNLLFMSDKSKPKELQQLKRQFLVCPSCGRPLSDFDLGNRKCSSCKAQ